MATKKSNSVSAVRAAAAKRIARPFSGTAAGASATAEGARQADMRRDQVEVVHALGVGAYDRIRNGGTSR